MGWVKGSDRNFEAAQTERYRKTKKDRRERRDTSGGGPKIRVSWVYSKREKAESEFGIDKEKKCKSEDHG